jgi:trans-2,3-dihydro-3-hydroxyanthranilate isomerase
MQRCYVTTDVFTDQVFGGNPLAVVLDAEGLSTAQMQSIALEFNYSETTFVLPPDHYAHTAKVRIFTPRIEVPFAGHPNVGTAFALARDPRFAAATAGGSFVFEEQAGLVPLTLLHENGVTVGAELRAPEALSRRATVPPEVAAACLTLDPRDIAMHVHAPQIVSVGLPFLVVQLVNRDALRHSRPNVAAHAEHLPLHGADAVFAYWRAPDQPNASHETVLHARTFAPLDGVMEDPATGSACAAAITLLATLDLAGAGAQPSPASPAGSSTGTVRAWRIHQGVDMGRPSLLQGRTVARDGTVTETYIGGRCAPVLEGSFNL